MGRAPCADALGGGALGTRHRHRSAERGDFACHGAGVHVGRCRRIFVDSHRASRAGRRQEQSAPIVGRESRSERRRGGVVYAANGAFEPRHPFRGFKRAGDRGAADRRVFRGADRYQARADRGDDVRPGAPASNGLARAACARNPRLHGAHAPRVRIGVYAPVIDGAHRFICVCTTSATSFASSVATRVCQIWVLLPRWTTLVWPISAEPAGAEPTKLVLLSIVVVPLASAGRLMKAAAAPSVSAKLMIAPPWAMPPIVHRSGRISIRAARESASALMNSIPSNWANGSGLALMRSISDMRIP